jgi:hypothetical protein
MTDYHRTDRSEYTGSAFSAQAQYHGEKINTARQAAEALFAPKTRIIEPSAPAAAPSADQTARKPRILSALPVQPSRAQEIEAHVAPVPPRRREGIPASHLGRIRTWLKYGMTIPEVAKIYGGTIDDIERILQKA